MSALSAPPARFPFANSTSRLEIIPNGIDVEEESRLYDDLVFDTSPIEPRPPARPHSPVAPPSVFSNDIWLGDNCGESAAFAREVKISGWTSVGDALQGAYVVRTGTVYDCVIKTKEGTPIHAHKRYSDFVALESQLMRTLPVRDPLFDVVIGVDVSRFDIFKKFSLSFCRMLLRLFGSDHNSVPNAPSSLNSPQKRPLRAIAPRSSPAGDGPWNIGCPPSCSIRTSADVRR
ncbi:PX domain protein [Mycena sanguinolenta]|uniref:PX domain protein n=1 Tax=Mycena sanguinolenta TaxID=230812 RepID=A0A8H6ZJY3_9AGAR|nr:PX domain protein [Mycena sanguinolenta]